MNSSNVNLFLSGISAEGRAALLSHASAVELPLHTVLYEANSTPRHAYFPLSGLASVLTAMPNGDSAEVSFTGKEGVVGGLHLLGPASMSVRCVMQLAGAAIRIPHTQLQHAFANSAEVHSRVLEFVQEQAATVAQIAGCNRLHSAEQRLTRWLLMAQDRTGSDSLAFTQEYLSQMISTQRTTVTLIAGDLHARGLIRYSRGTIHMLDRPGLEAATCVCYPVVKALYVGLFQRESASSTAVSNGPGHHDSSSFIPSGIS